MTPLKNGKRTTIRVETEDYEKLVELAWRRRVDTSTLYRQAIKSLLEAASGELADFTPKGVA